MASAEPAALLDRVTSAFATRYPIERELGRGGMATVYLAHDPKHGRLVAVKVFRPELATSVGAERFLREIQVAARLTHPHILPLHDSGEVEGLLYYVMPYIDGESLRDRLQREHRLEPDQALVLGREVADALDYAHQHGVVHRDMKPENILLADGQAVVADFGIARAVSYGAELLPDGSPGHRHADVHEPRTGGERSRTRRPERHLQSRLRAVRGARRRSSVPGPDGQGDARRSDSPRARRRSAR